MSLVCCAGQLFLALGGLPGQRLSALVGPLGRGVEQGPPTAVTCARCSACVKIRSTETSPTKAVASSPSLVVAKGAQASMS